MRALSVELPLAGDRAPHPCDMSRDQGTAIVKDVEDRQPGPH